MMTRIWIGAIVVFLGWFIAGYGYQEAPMLHALVEQGLLPPVEERLPEHPVVIQPWEEIGRYGGAAIAYQDTWVYPTNHSAEWFIGYEPLLRCTRDYGFGEPNIAEGYEWSEDGRVLTIYLRKGLRWSDGHPFTAEDIVFYFEYEAFDPRIRPELPRTWVVDGKPIEVTAVDDYTVQIQLPKPWPSIINYLSHAWGTQVGSWVGFFAPAHYCKQFHPAFIGEDQADELAKKEGYESWAQWYADKTRSHFGLTVSPDGPPTLSAYVCVERGPDKLVFQRNPYYWKVDPAGNQLPYIDQVICYFGPASQEVVTSKVLSGEVDIYVDHLLSLDNLSLYKENEDKGGYRILLWRTADREGIAWNLTMNDPVLRQIVLHPNFRKAMSLAIDRDEMSKLLWFGLGKPAPYYADPLSPYYEEEYDKLAREYVRYDPVQGNALLDEMGLIQRDSEGYRLRPDGKRLTLIFDYVGAEVSPTQ